MFQVRRSIAPIVAALACLASAQVVSAQTAVEVTIASDARRAEVGDVVTFRLEVANTGEQDLSRAFVRFVAARGFDVMGDSAAARVAGGAPAVLRTSRGSGSDRITRLGPLDVPAGSRASVSLRAVVGVDTRPGQVRTKAVITDAGGVLLSSEASVIVDVEKGRGLESSIIVGRVYCDDDGDQEVDAGERGVFGARVLLDSGSFALTDAGGLFHFSRVAEGTRRVKLDDDSIGADSVRGLDARQLRVTPGLPGRANFPLKCARERIEGTNPLVTLSHATRPMTPADPGLDQTLRKRLLIEGDLLLLAVKLDGVALELPSASVRALADDSVRVAGDGGINLKAVPSGGYGIKRPRFVLGFSPPSGVVATRWTFVITAADPSARARKEPFFSLSGNGKPPAAIDWDGRGNDGSAALGDRLYVAQLVVIGSRAKIEAASALAVFGVDFGRVSSSRPTSIRWTGPLFGVDGKKRPTATVALTDKVGALAKSLSAGDRLEIEVHAGKVTSRIEALATTQEQADLIKSLAVARGLDAKAIVARGRGAAEPIATGAGADAKNRRVEVRLRRKPSENSGQAVPRTMAALASALVDGQPVEVSDGGQFRWDGAVPKRGAVLIDVQAQDGRRAAVDVALGPSGRGVNQSVRDVAISANLSSPQIRLGGRDLDPRLLELDIEVETTAAGGKRLRPVVPQGMAFARGQIVVVDAGATRRIEVTDPSKPVPMPVGLGNKATVRLILELGNGSRAYSPKRSASDGRVSPPAKSGEILVNGVAWPVVNATAEGMVAVAAGGAVLIDARRPTGQRALYVAVLDPESGHSDADDPVLPDFGGTISRPVRTGVPVTRGELLASAAANFWVELPPAAAEISRRLPVRGQVRAGSQLTINDAAVAVDALGRFSMFVDLPPGLSELRVVSIDAKGFRAELHWPVKARRNDFVTVGLGELVVATSQTDRGMLADTAYLAGMGRDTTLTAGPLLIHGRATLYLKGELAPKRGFKKVSFTVHLDTSRRRDGSAFFEDVLNPARDQPIFGDSAIEVRDANGRDKLYARIDADDSHAVLGSLAAELGRGELFRYGRTIDGVGVSLERKLGSSRLGLDGFAATQSAPTRRDHVVYRSTGGTLYYLRFANVIEGSELIRVVVRDRDSGMISSERQLRRNIDYSIDYLSGRIWLIEPVTSSEPSGAIMSNTDSSLTPESGNPIFIEARYEHSSSEADRERAAGFEARYGVRGFELSAGAAGERRGEDEGYSVWGARAAYRAGKRSRLSAEIAGSKRREGQVELSVDGGLSFRDLGWADPMENPNDDRGLAWSLNARVFGGDFVPTLEGTRVELYAKGIDREFSASGSELERGRLKFGGALTTPLTDRDDLALRHRADVADVPRIGPTADDIPMGSPFALDERATYLTSLGWVGRRGRLTHQIEAAHHRLSSTAARLDGSASLDARRFGVAGRSSLALSKRLRIDAFQEVWTGVRDADPVLSPIDINSPTERESDPLAGVTSGLALAWRLLPNAAFASEIRQRWNGDQSAQIGLRAKLSRFGSLYLAERATRTSDGPVAVTVIGADDRFGPGGMGRSYGEYQIENTSSGARNRAVLGLGQRLKVSRDVALGIGFEHQQVFGGFLPDGTPVGNNQRDLIRGSLDIAIAAKLRVGIVAELRADRGTDDGALTDSDPRDPSGDGFADHGGVAPGAPLVLPSGDLTQVVASAGATWQPQRGVSVFARGRGARTWSGPAIGFTELTGGLAYRSLLDDRLAVLLRYSFLTERRPEATELERDLAHVLAVVPVADLSKRWRLSGKAAFKRKSARGGLASDVDSNATLALARLGYRVFGNWDATIEGRGLFLSAAGASELKVGALAELGYYFDEFFRFGVGYNFSHFNDQELGDLTRDAHGFFLRLTAEL